MAGGGDELKLLGLWASPMALRTKLALGFKGLPYEYIEEDLHNKSELLLSSNPVHKRVPVLIHNGKPVSESMVIVQYIEEAFAGVGPSLLPTDPHERAVARFWAAYIDDKFFSSWLLVYLAKTDDEKEEGKKQSSAAAETLEGALRDCSKGKPFFGGENVGYVDVALGCFVAWVHPFEQVYGVKLFDAARTPLLAAWLERFTALDAVKDLMPDAGKMVDNAKMRQVEVTVAAAAAATATAATARGN